MESNYWFEYLVKHDRMTVEGDGWGNRSYITAEETGDGEGEPDELADFVYGDAAGSGWGGGEGSTGGVGNGDGDGSGLTNGYGDDDSY